jgi:hypothetical protein
LSDLSVIGGNYEGVIHDDGTGVEVIIPDEIDVENP